MGIRASENPPAIDRTADPLHLGKLLEELGDAFALVDRDWRFVYVNSAAAKRADLTVAQMLGQCIWDTDARLAGSELETRYRRAAASGITDTFAHRDEPSGRWFEHRLHPTPFGLAILAVDITERKASEDALRRSEVSFHELVKGATEAIWVLDEDAQIVLINPRMAELLGAAPHEILGRPKWDFLFDEDRAAAIALFERGRLGGCEQGDFRLRRTDQRPIWTMMAARPLFDDDGRFRGGLDRFIDITERRRAEEALRESEARSRQLADKQALLIEAGRILGSSLDYESTLAQVCRLVVPELADWCSIDLLAESGTIRRVAFALADPAHEALVRELRSHEWPRPEDDPALMRVLQSGELLLHSEITDEILARGARSEQQLERLKSLRLSSVMVVPLTGRGRTLGAITLVTADSGRRFEQHDVRLAQQLAGRAALAVDNAWLFSEAQEAARRREEVLQQHLRVEEQLMLLLDASDTLSASLDLPAVLDAILALARRLIPADAYAVWRYNASSSQWSIVSSSGLSAEYQQASIRVLETAPGMLEQPVIAENVDLLPMLEDRRAFYQREGVRSLLAVTLRVHGTVSGTLVFYYRSPHKFSTVELRVGSALANLAASALGTAELYEELKANDRRKDEFLAMLAHELRNPLAAMASACQVAKYGAGHDDHRWSLGIIETQLKHLARLIDDLLDVSRITRGKIVLQLKHVDLRPILESAVGVVRPLIDDKGHRLTIELGSEPLPLHADPTRLEQVLVNLLNNAAKYTPARGHLAVSAESAEREIVISVRDDGIGMTRELLARAFELFAQGDRSVARSEGGLGIGLTLVKSLVEMHGGTIVAASAGPNRGSQFTIRLPRSESAPTDIEQPREHSARGSGLTILVVEDNEDTARAMARLLRLLGHDVNVVLDGHAALSEARARRPDVILLDLGLPGMDGYEVAKTLRDEGFGDTLIIAVSGYGEEQARQRTRDCGFNHHLVKPVDIDTLTELIATPR
jgi:PAS domain S-box-containing protein